MLEFITTLPPSFNLPALFFLSFLAATLLPLGSEWFLIILLQKAEYAPIITVLVAGIGNTLGGYTNYIIGRLGSSFFITKILRLRDTDIHRATNFYKKWGSWSLFFSWLPIIGDPLCFIAGVLKMHQGIFVLFVFTGKLFRYFLIAYITLQVN